MRSKNFIKERINWISLFAKLSISIFTKNGLQVSVAALFPKAINFALNKRRVPQFNNNDGFVCHGKLNCRYFIYGLQDAQHLERVRLEFQMFEIQKGEHKADKE